MDIQTWKAVAQNSTYICGTLAFASTLWLQIVSNKVLEKEKAAKREAEELQAKTAELQAKTAAQRDAAEERISRILLLSAEMDTALTSLRFRIYLNEPDVSSNLKNLRVFLGIDGLHSYYDLGITEGRERSGRGGDDSPAFGFSTQAGPPEDYSLKAPQEFRAWAERTRFVFFLGRVDPSASEAASTHKGSQQLRRQDRSDRRICQKDTADGPFRKLLDLSVVSRGPTVAPFTRKPRCAPARAGRFRDFSVRWERRAHTRPEGDRSI